MTNMMTVAQINEASRNGSLDRIVPRAISKVKVQEHKMIQITSNTVAEMPAKRHLLKRLGIAKGRLILLCATGCSGKTMLVQYLACCISTGTPVFGQFPVEQGGVVHIDMEQAEEQTLIRYARLANGINNINIDVFRITLSERFDTPGSDLGAVEQELLHYCKGKAMCIIDSLKAVSAADENTAQIETVLKMFKRVASQSGCAILLVHHKGKGKDAKQSGRGHSSIYDSVDVQLDLEMAGEIYEISCAKNRDGRFFDGLKYKLNDTGDYVEAQDCTEKLEFELLRNDVKNIKIPIHDKIIEVLSTNAGINHNGLFELVRGDRTKFRDALDNLIITKTIVETKGTHGSKMYSLSPETQTTQEWK